ncbi:OmpA family protein [uncultured Maribacter sp.]|uniref:OmpA family protein n=1 Tax=uncultured Maribacter sp. TaxID=431308 RepID=UPI002632843A|nr:OmpA family protein [uncultured Maribacter sp.]
MCLVKNIFLVVFLFQITCVQSQNLVKNPSFESFEDCPKELGNVTTDVKYWSRATQGTSDYFNECSYKMGVPDNFNGTQSAAFGKGYAGMYLLAPNNYREYLQGELNQTLEKGKRYGVTFYISLSEKSMLAIQELGILFSEKHIDVKSTKVIGGERFINGKLLNMYTYEKIHDPKFYTDKEGWAQVYVEIIAKGQENFLTIGNFKDDATTKTKKTKGVKSASYYYLDMVSVIPIENSIYSNLMVDRVYALKNVLFSTDEYALDSKSKSDLKILYNQLKKNPELFITIHAHTDNEGVKSYNKDLSENRAKSVASYLMKLGVKENRIQWYGHGDEKPVVDNVTSEDKKKNRRAEFVLTKRRFAPGAKRSSFAETRFEEDN